jgi:hypothetical protein
MGCWDIIGPFAVVKGCAHNPTQFVVLVMCMLLKAC